MWVWPEGLCPGKTEVGLEKGRTSGLNVIGTICVEVIGMGILFFSSS